MHCPGELVSSSSDSTYFFEPLWYYVDSKQSRSPTFEEKKSLILNLLKCNFHDPRIKKMIFSSRYNCYAMSHNSNYFFFLLRQSTFVFRKPSILGLKYDKTKIGRMGFLKRMEIKCRKTKIRYDMIL